MVEGVLKQNFRRYLFWAVVILFVILSYLILKEFIIALLSAFILAYLIRPIYRRIAPKIGKSFSAFICVAIIIIIIIIPISIIVNQLTQRIYYLINPQSVQAIIAKIIELPLIKILEINPSAITQEIIPFFFKFTTNSLKQIPSLVISFFITLIAIYYILKNWGSLSDTLEKFIPFKDKKKIKKELAYATNRIVYGYMLIALIEFLISFIGFYFFGVKYFILLPVLIAILAFIPGLGPLIVWAPLAIFHIFAGDYVTAIGVIIVGLIVSVGIDNLIAPRIVGKASKIHPFIILLGILGGVPIFGIFGFILGPLILAYTISLIKEGIKHPII